MHMYWVDSWVFHPKLNQVYTLSVIQDIYLVSKMPQNSKSWQSSLGSDYIINNTLSICRRMVVPIFVLDSSTKKLCFCEYGHLAVYPTFNFFKQITLITQWHELCFLWKCKIKKSPWDMCKALVTNWGWAFVSQTNLCVRMITNFKGYLQNYETLQVQHKLEKQCIKLLVAGTGLVSVFSKA